MFARPVTPAGMLRLSIQTPDGAKAARLWVAKSDSRDFRKSTWVEQAADLTAEGKGAVGVCPRPESGWLALYGEVDYEEGGVSYSLATQVRVEKAK